MSILTRCCRIGDSLSKTIASKPNVFKSPALVLLLLLPYEWRTSAESARRTPEERPYADGNHIHGGGGRNDLFVGGSVVDGGIDFRASVPTVLFEADSSDKN